MLCCAKLSSPLYGVNLTRLQHNCRQVGTSKSTPGGGLKLALDGTVSC